MDDLAAQAAKKAAKRFIPLPCDLRRPRRPPRILRYRVVDIARGTNASNAQPNQQGLAMVNPIFTWVRLAQRAPVRIRLKYVPDGVRLVAGLTATVQVDPRSQPSK